MTTPAIVDQLILNADLTREFLLHHGICPVKLEGERLELVLAEDGDPGAVRDLELSYSATAVVRRVTRSELEHLVESLTMREAPLLPVSSTAHAEDDELTADVRTLANQPPVIRYVNLLVRDAVEARASDIHLESGASGTLAARFRIDGVLQPASTASPPQPAAVLSRVKLLAELDTAERRRPQDGRIRVRLDARDIDLRVSTVPTMHGESVVVRLLDQGGRPAMLSELGMADDTRLEMESLADRPSGLLLVTGPTGSGKTTTLYSALSRRDTSREKLITVEDPVEYRLAGVTQVPVHQRTGVSMGSILRSILRQDPDVIMVGEMRDAETAEVAIQAAMTGHLVFSTLHTTDSIGAIPRLLDLGVDDYLVAATLEGVLAQRLVRRVCDGCRASYLPAAETVALVSGRPSTARTLTHGLGCDQCRGTGFRGRVGLFELLRLDDVAKDLISRGGRRSELSALLADRGVRTLRLDGWQKALAGLTTVEEVLRVTVD